ncbi:MAG: FAD-binding and (Fe-S)-binding domain-containing protein [Cellvibrionaceae bacterium]
MLPRLDAMPEAGELYQRFARQLRERGFAGDIHLDFSSRTLQSTDNSIYQRFPQGVLYPAKTEDVICLAELSQQPTFQSLSFCPRGGGTGTNGQALDEGFVVDLSKHMNRILEIDPEQRWARVQAGVVKDQLNAALEPHGLFFAPDLSTSNRATIGGMINTDASGQGSCRYGKTRNHLLEVETVFIDGSRWMSRPIDDRELAFVGERQDRIGQIHRLTNNIHIEHRQLINTTFPPLNRSLTGYDLAHLRDNDNQFDLNSLLCGSEGTLGFITEAVVSLEPLPRYTALAVFQYDDFVAALRDCRVLLRTKPTAVETIDNTIVELAKGDEIWPSVSSAFSNGGLAADGNIARHLAAVNFVEFTANSEAQLATLLEDFSRSLEKDSDNPRRLGYTLIRDGKTIKKIWAMRKKSVGLLGNTPGHKRPVPFVEDTAVPPEHLADYIAEFRTILDKRQLSYGMFGHADAGVIHVRPALDMRDLASIQTVREISDQVFALTQRYGGVLWGEHGKGVRSEYSPATFGDLYPQLQRIKAAFDPHNQLNSGKIATPESTPSSTNNLLRIDTTPTRGARDRLIPTAIWDDYGDAVNCNGNAACFNWNPDQSMCPSWKGTRERKYSPKGRAMLMKEWLSQLAKKNCHPQRAAAAEAPPFNLFRKLAASLQHWRGQEDFSHEVYDSMDACLACKACTTGCPVQVDVPAFRSIFFSYYFRRYLRPVRHHFIASMEVLLPWAAIAPAFYNGLTQWRPMQWLIGKLVGLTAIPPIRGASFRGELEKLNIRVARPELLRELSSDEKKRSVILVQDVFTRFFEADLVLDICRFLKAMGIEVWLAPFKRNGKPLHVLGFLSAFNRVARDTADNLQQLAASGIALVGIEPSMTLTYRGEYRQSLGKDVTPDVLLLQEWLAQHGELLRANRARFAPAEFRLLPHCSEAALANASLADWQTLFTALGCSLNVEAVGCCGMAGTFGHETKHLATSKTIYSLSWAAKIAADKARPASATGFSCRCQVARFSESRIPHPFQLLLGQLQG